MDLNQYADAIASIESAGSGDYQAVGPRTRKGNRAYGRYQVMDFNIGPWTEKYLGERLTPEQFLASPEAQDAVFQGEFGSYVNRYGNPQDAASAWFTGRPLSEGAGRSDILGTTGAGYVNKFNAALGAGGNMQRQPGLLGTPTVSTQGQAPEQERQPFFRRPAVGDFFDRLAIGLQGMTLNPNQGLIQASQGRIQQRREAAQTEQQRNRTADWLESQGMGDLAQGVRSGALGARDALTMARGAEATSKQRDYQYLLQQGVPPEQAMERVFGAGGVSIDLGERESAFEKEIGKSIAGMATELVQQGAQASQTLAQLGALEEALKEAPQGMQGAITIAAGNLGIPMEGLSEAQAAQAIINRLVPQQRPAGSGPMSDADLELFKQSLPRIINQPGGNQRILDTMRGIAEYDRKRGEIAARLMNGEIDQAQALQQLNTLPNPLDWVRGSSGQGATGGAGESIEIDGQTVTIREVK